MNGWSPATVTVDAHGEVVSLTVTEPRFSPRDVHVLLESRRLDAVPRGSHGFPLTEATDPNVRGRVRIPPPTVDFIQRDLNREQAAYSKAWPDADMDSLLWSAEVAD